MKSFANKIEELGGKLSPPATAEQINELESKLKYQLPLGLSRLLMRHNGTSQETDEAIWDFWTCSKISSYQEYREQEEFLPDNNWLRRIDPSARAVRLPASKIILFADSMIELPTYGIFHSPGHKFDGIVFDTSYGSVSALSFDAWIAAFVDHGEDGLLLHDNEETEQGGDGDAEESV